MSIFTDEYVKLLIKQYYEKPNAAGEIAAMAANYEKIRDLYSQFPTEFDLDSATGDRLDKIGKIVGLDRGTESAFAADSDYRFYLRVRIAQNTGSAFMISDTKTSIQDVISFAFGGLAYVIDNQNMTLSLYISSTFSIAQLLVIIQYQLLPKPQAVGYEIVMVDSATPFGYSESTGVYGFSELAADSFQLSTGDTLELSTLDTLAVTDKENPIYYSTDGIYSELFGY